MFDLMSLIWKTLVIIVIILTLKVLFASKTNNKKPCAPLIPEVSEVQTD